MKRLNDVPAARASISVTGAFYARLARRAKQEGVSISKIVEHVLERALDQAS